MRRFRLFRSLLVGSMLVLFVLGSPASAVGAQPGSMGRASVASASPAGTRLWLARFASGSATSLQVGPDGTRVYVAGTDEVLAYDAVTGHQLWEQANTNAAVSLGVSPDGTKIFVTGTAVSPTTSSLDYATSSYDAATGTPLWTAYYDGPASYHDFAASLGVSSDGAQVFVTGRSTGWLGYDNVDYDYATIAYDASTGAQLWAARFNGPAGHGYDEAVALAVSPDGALVFVTGDSYTGGNPGGGCVTIAYDAATGAEAWNTRAGITCNAPTSLGISHDGTRVFVTGDATIAYDAVSGSRLWTRRFIGGGFGYRVDASLDGSKVFIAGSVQTTTTDRDLVTVAYDTATGANVWSRRYNGPANGTDSAAAIGESPDGSRVYVTGTSVGITSGNDYVTIGYDASTGARSWIRRFNGLSNGEDDAAGLGVSPDGNVVYVTGASQGSATIAYQAR